MRRTGARLTAAATETLAERHLKQLAVIIAMLKELASGIGDHQLDDPTPCVDFTVAGVLDHMTVLASAFARMFRGELPPMEKTSTSTATDRKTQFIHGMDEVLNAVESPGARDRTIEGPVGPMPGPVFARLIALDGLVHGWDLASSTEQDWQSPQALLTEVDAFARQAITPEVRASGAFAAEQEAPDSAGTLRRLVSLTGRSTSRVENAKAACAHAAPTVGYGSCQNRVVSPRRSRIPWLCCRVCGRQSGASRSPHHACASSASVDTPMVVPGVRPSSHCSMCASDRKRFIVLQVKTMSSHHRRAGTRQ